MNRGTLKVVRGDVTSPQFTEPNEIAIIPHCCNNLGAMGAGVAKALRDKWPFVYNVYKAMEDESSKGLQNRLGENCYAKIDGSIIVVNMIGQDGTVSIHNPKPVKYWALMKCMGLIRADIISTLHMKPMYANRKAVIHTPKFGSDLAGGNWYFILDLIKEQWLDCGMDVVVYEFESDTEKFGEVHKMDLVRAEEIELHKRLKELKDERVIYTRNQFKTDDIKKSIGWQPSSKEFGKGIPALCSFEVYENLEMGKSCHPDVTEWIEIFEGDIENVIITPYDGEQ